MTSRFPYQRINDNPSTHDLGQSSGAATDPPGYITSRGLPEDLDDIFEWMLDLGTPQYEHDLAEYIHHGYSGKSWYKTEADPERQTLEAEYFEEQRKEKERRIRIANKIKTLHVTKKEDLDILKPKEAFGFRCYSPKCEFTSNDKAEYENHGVTKHPGKPCYPGKSDLKLYNWKPQGQKWEV